MYEDSNDEEEEEEGGEEVILLEDFDPDLDSEFLNDFVKPYFSTLFKDLTMRRLS